MPFRSTAVVAVARSVHTADPLRAIHEQPRETIRRGALGLLDADSDHPPLRKAPRWLVGLYLMTIAGFAAACLYLLLVRV